MQQQESFKEHEENDLSGHSKVQLPPSTVTGRMGAYLPKEIASGRQPRGVSLFRAKLVTCGYARERPAFEFFGKCLSESNSLFTKIELKSDGEAMDRTDHKRLIQTWFETALYQGGIERYYDLHVDDISEAWERPNTWISAALESFDIAREIRDGANSIPSPTVVLAFALQYGSSPIGLTFNTRSQLEKTFNATPPSLYLFRSGSEFWKLAERSQQKVDLVLETLDPADLFGEEYREFGCIYMEYLWQGQEEYSRNLYLVG